MLVIVYPLKIHIYCQIKAFDVINTVAVITWSGDKSLWSLVTSADVEAKRGQSSPSARRYYLFHAYLINRNLPFRGADAFNATDCPAAKRKRKGWPFFFLVHSRNILSPPPDTDPHQPKMHTHARVKAL